MKINHIKNDSVEIEWKSFNNRNPARINNEIYLAHYVPQPLKLQFDKINVSFFFISKIAFFKIAFRILFFNQKPFSHR